MERKKMQRIIGILVVIGLIVIVIPLLFGKNDAPMQEASTVKAPPFPDQQQTNTEKTPDASVAQNTVNNPAPNLPAPAAVNPNPVAAKTPAPAADSNVTKSDVATPTPAAASAPADSAQPAPTNSADNTKETGIIYERPKDIVQPTSTTTATPTPTLTPTSTPTDTTAPVAQNPLQQTVAPPAATPAKIDDVNSVPTTKIKPAVLEKKSHRTMKVKPAVAKNSKKMLHQASEKSSWAIQMGSFKVKNNALRLTNRLRAAGYKAYYRDIKSASGHNSTRVYIGPELKQAAAVKLSSDVYHHLNLQGVIIPYKKVT